VDALEYEKPKTKDLAALLKKLDAAGKKGADAHGQ